MRAFVGLVVTICIAIGVGIGVVAAVGPNATQKAGQSDNAALTSLATSPNVQMNMSFGGNGLNLSADNLQGLSLGLAMSTNNSVPIENASTHNMGFDVSINHGAKHLIDIRLVNDRAIYVEAELEEIVRLPQIPSAVKKELTEVAPLLGGRWFQLPQSIVNSLKTQVHSVERKNSSIDQPANRAQLQQLGFRIESVAQHYAHGSIVGTNHGYATTITADLGPLFKAITPLIQPLEKQALSARSQLPIATPTLKPNAIRGTVVATIHSDSRETLQSLNVHYLTAGKQVIVNVDVTHLPIAITAPASSSPLPQQLLDQLKQLGSKTAA